MEGDPNVGSSSSSAIKKRRRSSEVWKEMRKYKDGDGNVKAECKHCKKSFDGSSENGTTRLWNHLKSCPANPKRKEPGGRDGDDQDQSLSPSTKTKELASLIKQKSFRDLIQHLSNTERDTIDDKWKDLVAPVLKSRKDEILQLYQEEKEKLRQFLNNLSCRFSLLLVDGYPSFMVVYYIDDSWERRTKIFSYWQDPLGDVEDWMEAVKQSCLDWKIDRNICSVLIAFRTEDNDEDCQIENMERWFSQRGSLPFAGCLRDIECSMDYIDRILFSQKALTATDGNGIQTLNECAKYVYNKSRSDELSQLDSAVENAIAKLKLSPPVRLKEVFYVLEQLDSDFRSTNLAEQKWDEITATFEHLKFLKDVAAGLSSGKCDIPIIVDLPYVHKILKDRCNHRIEDCLFCENVMKEAVDLFFGKYNLVRVIAIILDPRFKMDGVQLRCREIYGSDADRYFEKLIKDFRDVYDAYVAADSSNSESYEMVDAMGRPCTSSSPKSELDRYFNLLKVPRDEQFDILAWWRGNSTFYPTLARMARDYLALPFIRCPAKDAFELLREIICVHHVLEFHELAEIIAAWACLRGFLSSAENSYYW